MNYISTDFKLGIIAGGQLGKMMALAASNLDLTTYVMDTEQEAPASSVCKHFFIGDYSNYQDVYDFGKKVDLLTLELEHVNIEALLQLKKEGKEIHPDPDKLKIIQDKGLQKQHFKTHQLPSSAFSLYESKEEILKAILKNELQFPFVQKSRTLGYDGKGVIVIQKKEDLENLLDVPSMIEGMVVIEKELSVIVARNKKGAISYYPPVEMIFNKDGNLVDMLLCPANISKELAEKSVALAIKTIESFNICGLLAVELFLDGQNEIWINEVAPRPHNSGHHTIESSYTSQYEQHLRAVLDFPLGSTEMMSPSVMLNLLGEKGYKGPVIYEGIEKCLAVEGAKFHIYGKKQTKPLRKMGHVTVLDKSIEKALSKANYIKENLKIKA